MIASNAEADDPRLVGLFDTAEAAGVPEVIVAQDRVPADVPMPGKFREQAAAPQEAPADSQVEAPAAPATEENA